MSKLTASERKKIPGKEFAGPDRSFPIEDRSHAEAAIKDAPKSEHAGNISHSEEEAIVRKARAKLDKHPTRIAIRKASEAVAAKYK